MGMLRPGTEDDYLAPTMANLYYPPRAGDYRYFETVRFQGNTGFRLGNLGWAADASMLAYARSGQERMSQSKFQGILESAGFETREVIGDFAAEGSFAACGFLAATEDFAILAFRGSEPANAQDVVADACVMMAPFFTSGGLSAGRVHLEYWNRLLPIWNRLAEVVAAYRTTHPNQEICVTGHDLGGVLATLAFQSLREEHSSLYTFGCPRIGDEAFCADVAAVARNCSLHRVVNNQDVVPHLPATSLIFPFDHPKSGLLWIDEHGSILADQRMPLPDAFQDLARAYFFGCDGPIPGPLADHSVVRYCQRVGQACLVADRERL